MASPAFLTRAACQGVYVLPGQRPGDGDLLTTASRGTHDRAAIQLAAQLAEPEERRLTGLYIEPDIGPDAPNVGRRILDRVLERAVDEKAGEVRRPSDDAAAGSRSGDLPGQPGSSPR